MCSANTIGLFEIHIAGPRIDVSTTRKVFDDLKKVGLTKSKFFLGVYNITNKGQVACTPPTGHDLDNPGFMSTIKTPDFEEAKQYVIAGMKVLASYGLKGNFEIEKVISKDVPDYNINVKREFPDYQRVHDSPKFENHIIWRNEITNLPSNEDICNIIEKRLGIIPHQIVDFSRDPSGESLVSRVATIYQPNRLEALKFAQLEDEKLTGHKYMVTEQVCLVAELKSS